MTHTLSMPSTHSRTRSHALSTYRSCFARTSTASVRLCEWCPPCPPPPPPPYLLGGGLTGDAELSGFTYNNILQTHAHSTAASPFGCVVQPGSTCRNSRCGSRAPACRSSRHGGHDASQVGNQRGCFSLLRRSAADVVRCVAMLHHTTHSWPIGVAVNACVDDLYYLYQHTLKQSFGRLHGPRPTFDALPLV